MSTSTEPCRARTSVPQRAGASTAGPIQLLTVVLDGITASDYLAWVRDPEPSALGRALRSVSVEADPVEQRIDLELVWDRQAPAPETAVAAAGFALTPEVVAVQDRGTRTDQREETDMHNSHIQAALVQARVDELHRAAARVRYQRPVGSPGRAARISIRAVSELIARRI
ncbi:hypothetical protein, partial [Bradyrhizobium sp.]|uniref:hypothetical protein n=1 Tax=Bradyrhizobium sp. TaxID=376 RepID=UPI0025C163A3